MFESKESIAKAVKAVHALTEKLERGDVLTHAAIKAVLGLEPHDGRWDHVVNKVRRMLEDGRGISTWPVTNEGYKLLTREEQLQLPSWRTVRAIRHFKKSRRAVRALPDRGLTVNQRRAKAFLGDALRDSERGLRRDLRAQREAARPTPTIPRRPHPPAEERVAQASV
jgi:hypothetical protein